MVESIAEFAPWLGVFETLKVIDGVPLFVPEHLKEMGRAMTALGLETDFDFEAAAAQLPAESGRWRWLVTKEGARTFFTAEPEFPSRPVELSVSTIRVGSNNWDARYKTVSYLSHVQAAKLAPTSEVVLLNEHGDIASASRANIFWSKDGTLYTPTHESGCRRGVVRSFVCTCVKVKASYFPSAALLEADEIFLTNSMKGIVSVKAVKGRKWTEFPIADELREEYANDIAEQVREGKS